MLSFSEIHAFVASAETGSFSKAARRLHLSQPAVSQQIHSLECYLGTKLFQRNSRGVTLTDAGKALLPMARELLSLSHRIRETMNSLEARSTAHLTVGCTAATGKVMLPLVVAAFNQERPDTRLTIEMNHCDSVERALLAQEIQLGISGRKVAHRNIECQSFFTDHVTLVVPPDHPFAHRSSVQPDELIGQPFILHSETSSTRKMVQEELEKQGIRIDQLQVVMIAEQAEALGVAVEHRLGIAFTCRLAARHGLRSGYLVEVPVEGLRLERPLYLMHNTHSPTQAAQSQFWSFVGTHQDNIAQIVSA
jgi:LysR family transcriptional regulator, transcriptional activator of the cysJI operon